MYKFLIADDEYAERRLLESTIRAHWGLQAEIKCVENGREALDIAKLWMPDIALLDIEMPGLNGLEAAKAMNDAKLRTGIIFVSAYSIFAYAHEAVKLGAIDYILKPVDTDEVIRSTSQAIEKLRTTQQLEGVSGDLKEGEENEGLDKTGQVMQKVLVYLQHNYMTYDLSLDRMSDLLKINPSYFSSLFKKSTGVNFIDYVADLKISAAKTLLQDPLRSGAEIAQMVGYESASYFTRAFKKRTGQTPTEYRKSANRKGSET